jgi:ABC-type nitrate/sulfonate/bicarbonate transport system substrate-binding protein
MSEQRLNVGTFTRSILIHMARESGDLERAGLHVDESLVTSSPAQFASLENGELDLVFTSPDNVLAYQYLAKNPLGRTIPLRILSAIDKGVGLSLNLAPHVGDVAHVRDEVVGVDVPQSGFAFVAYELLARSGLAPGTYRLEALGSTPQRTAALVESRCAATVLNAGNELRARGLGCTSVSQVGELGPYIGTVIAAVPTNEERSNDAHARFCDVILQTSREILAGQRTVEVMKAATHLLELDESQAHEHYDCLMGESGLVADGVVDLRAIETLVELRRKYMPTPELDDVVKSIDDILIGSARR